MTSFTRLIIFLFTFFFSSVLYAQPTVDSFNPGSGPAGSAVTITGTNFNPNVNQNMVFFGAVKSTILTASSTALVVKVPTGATYEPISVIANNLTAYSGTPFITTFAAGSIDSATFKSKMNVKISQGAFGLAVGDLDGDSKPDIAYGNAGPTTLTSAYISVLPNTSTVGSVTFGQRLDFRGTGTIYDISIADLNSDGKPEVITGNTISNNFSVFKNTSIPGSISFAQSMTFFAGASSRGITIADFDNDGRPDVLTVNPPLVTQTSTLSIFRNTGENGTITFAPKIDFPLTTGVSRVTAADMDNDGKVDLIYSVNNKLSVFKNTSSVGNISFNSKLELNIDTRVTSAGDLDGDGKIDLSVVTGAGINFYRNNGTTGVLSFAAPLNVNVGSSFYQTALSDIDGNGKVDLMGFNADISTAFILKNNSTPGVISFAEKIDCGISERIYYVAGADLDGDAKPELLTYNRNDSISILRNKTGEPTTVSSGSNPVIGEVSNTVTVDTTVQTYKGSPYVQRHYDIEPEINPATSTATLSLYFSQSDFDNFNASPSHGLSLPSAPTDNAGKANLRVFQHHGTSETGVPGSYSGSSLEINPDDEKIVWNDLLKRWEVTFDVTGFSGFFISSSGNKVLPLTLLSFYGKVQEGNALLQWKTTSEINVSYFELQKSQAGGEYSLVSKVTATGAGRTSTTYNYTDKPGNDNSLLYRLKIVDKDGSYTFSDVIKINYNNREADFSVYPNPAHGSVVIEIPLTSTPSKLQLIDMSGKAVKFFNLATNITKTSVNLANVKPGSYKMIWTDGIVAKVQTIIIE